MSSVLAKHSVTTVSYTHCKTRILSLTSLDLSSDASEQDYKKIYQRLLTTRTTEARLLVDAISSVSIGLAPPVAFPTETVYGLGADATNPTNISGIFAAKGRPSDNPLIVHVASQQHLEHLTGEPLPSVYHDLVAEYWPGPLTILVPVPQNSVFAPNVHPGQRTIGFRVPESKYARFFIAATDKPIAAPSANSSGKPSPTTAQHVMDDLNGKINFILDGGSCNVGVESTVVDGLHDPPLILRPGGISQHDLIDHGNRHGSVWSKTAIGYKQTRHQQNGVNGISDTSDEEAPRAPGMKYKHYAPRGRLTLFEGTDTLTNLTRELQHLQTSPTTTTTASNPSDSTVETPAHIGILTSTTWSTSTDLTDLTLSSSSTTNPNTIFHILPLGPTPRLVAQTLFAALRQCDSLNCRYIFAEAPLNPSTSDMAGESEKQKVAQAGEDHHYDAVVERMRKAASEVVER